MKILEKLIIQCILPILLLIIFCFVVWSTRIIFSWVSLEQESESRYSASVLWENKLCKNLIDYSMCITNKIGWC